MSPEDWLDWRYSGRGRVRHAVEVRSKLRTPTRGPYLWPLCDQLQGMQDDEFEDTSMLGWFGVANAKQAKKLAELPYCRFCVSELSDFTEE